MSKFTRPVMGFSSLAFGRLGLVVGSPPLVMSLSCALTTSLTLAASAYDIFGIFGLTAKQPLLSTHTADNTSSILDGSHAIRIVWVLALGNHIANGDSIGDRTRTVNECFEIASNFNRMERSKFIQIKTYI
jgi:hypothetical protein